MIVNKISIQQFKLNEGSLKFKRDQIWNKFSYFFFHIVEKASNLRYAYYIFMHAVDCIKIIWIVW